MTSAVMSVSRLRLDPVAPVTINNSLPAQHYLYLCGPHVTIKQLPKATPKLVYLLNKVVLADWA